MEWNVKNALNRDVERQQLNKILKEIRDTIGNVEKSGQNTSNSITEIIRRPSPTPAPATPITITLEGDATGEGTGVSDITIPVVVNPDLFLEEAPEDNTPYWRINAAWEGINPIIEDLNYLEGKGIPVFNDEADESDSPWTIVQLEAEAGELTLDNPDGTTGNPLFGLADVADSGLGEIQGFERDVKGRVTGTRAVTTDDLDEGATNLYFTDERAQDAVGTILTDTGTIVWIYDDVANTITAEVAASVQASLDLADTALQDAPIDGATYGRLDGAWAVVTGGGGGGGTVTSVGTGTGLTGGPITGSGTIALNAVSIASLALADSAVQPGDSIPASDVTGLATVATTGAYSDLTGQPVIPAAQVNSDWAAVTGVEEILNKPVLGTMSAENAADYTPTSGFGSAAFSDTTDFDAAGAAAAAESAANVYTDTQVAGKENTFTKGDLVAGTNVSFTGSGTGRLVGSGNLTINATAGGGGSGTVTSVALSVPTGLSVAGSPITTSGTFTVTYEAGYQGYTTTEATKLAGIAAGAQVNVATDLAQGTRTSTTVPVTSSTGTSATLAAATGSLAGVMVAADKTKLDGVAAGATANTGTVTSVSTTGSTGLVVGGGPITTSGTLTFTLSDNLQGWSGIAPATKATLGNNVGFQDVRLVRNAAPLTGALYLGNTDTRYLFWDGTTYSVGGPSGEPLTLWHSGNLTPSAYLPLTGGTLTGNLSVGGSIVSTVAQVQGLAGGEGFQLFWNAVAVGGGRTEIVNNRGGGIGGTSFLERVNVGGTVVEHSRLGPTSYFALGSTSPLKIGPYPASSAYGMFGWSGMSGGEYAVLIGAGDANTYLSCKVGGSVMLRPNANGITGQVEISSTGMTINGGKKLSKITVSSAAPGALADGELYLRF